MFTEPQSKADAVVPKPNQSVNRGSSPIVIANFAQSSKSVRPCGPTTGTPHRVCS